MQDGRFKVEHKKLIGDRMRRIWAIAEHIAEYPGQTRYDLSQRFHLSERQVQADLNVLRTDMRLPVIRRSGYRFVDDDGTTSSPGGLRLRDALVLSTLIDRGRGRRDLAGDDLDGLAARLPTTFPPHLRPLAARVLGSKPDGVFRALATAILDGRRVRLEYRHPGGGDRWFGAHPVVEPELLVPYLDGWLLIATCGDRPGVAFLGDAVVAMSPSTEAAV